MFVKDEIAASQDESHILHPSSRMLFRFWEAMRAEQSAPSRADLDLKRIRPLVPSLFISQFDTSTHSFRWRLAGTGICDLYRRELTGSDMLAGFDPFEADVFRRHLRATMETRQPALLRFRFNTDLSEEIGAELAVFPLLAADRSSIHLFGGLFPFRDTAVLNYGGIVGFEIAAARLIWTENLPLAAEQPSEPVRRRFQVISGGRDRR